MFLHVLAASSVALALVSGSAQAQIGGGSKPMTGSFDKPLAQPEHGSRYVSRYSVNDDTYTLVIEPDGSRTVTHNDKPVPESQVRTRRGRLQVLDENGKLLHEFDLPGRGNDRPRGMIGIAPPQVPQPPQAPGNFGGALADPEHPKVMLGLRMNPNSDGEIEVASVISGLAAEAAGVQAGDVLVSLDGRQIEDASSIRPILKDKAPGDKVDLVVHRDGQDKTISITLQAYEPGKLGGSPAFPQGNTEEWNAQPDTGWAEHAQKAIEEAMETVKSSKAGQALRDEVNAALERALAAVRSAQAEGEAAMQRGFSLAERYRGLLGEGGPGAQQFFFRLPGGGNQQEAGDMEKRLEKLQERLDELNTKLDTLLKKN